MHRPFRFGAFGVSLASARELEARPVNARDVTSRIRQAEDLGYSTYLFPDHLGLVEAAPLPMLAFAAAATTTIRLGTLVLNNDFRNPAVLAKELATIDSLSGGRLEIGIGAGWLDKDYTEMGLAMDRPGRRIARLEESLRVLDLLLGGETCDFAGDEYEIAGLLNRPSCVQQPRPPILVGGASPRILRLAARHADIVGVTWNVRAQFASDEAIASRSPSATDQKVQWVRDTAGERVDEIEWHIHAMFVDVGDQAGEMLGEKLGIDDEMAGNPAFLESPHCLVGTPSQVVEKLLAARERWGFSYISVPDPMMEAMAPVVAELAGK